MQFQSVIGQQQIKNQLIQLVEQNRLSHALLFLGKEGSGALPLALAFAQYITCNTVNGQQTTSTNDTLSLFGDSQNEKQETDKYKQKTDSCNTCPSCKKNMDMVHPDIHFTYPVIPKKSGDKPTSADYSAEWREFIKQYPYGNSYDWLQFINAENKQGNITSDECNELIRKLNLKSFESGYKILILWMPEFLGKEGNKLLKLIEEPPPNTLFILVAENEDLILPTILSRTQLVKVPQLKRQDIEQALIERANVETTKAKQLATICQGNYREALQQLQHANEDWESLLREWLNHIAKQNLPAQVKWIDETSKLGRENQKQFLKYFIHQIEDAIELRTINNHPQTLINDFAQRFNKITNIAQQQAIADELNKASYYIERNANPKMLFHALTIKLVHIIKNNSLILIS